jgi:hypothetical protein
MPTYLVLVALKKALYNVFGSWHFGGPMKPMKFGKEPFAVTIYEVINRTDWRAYRIVWYHPVIRVRGALGWLNGRKKKQKQFSDKGEAIRYAERVFSKLMALCRGESL